MTELVHSSCGCDVTPSIFTVRLAQIKDEQNVLRYQTARRKDFDREEVSGRDTLPVRLQEGRPRHTLASFRRGIDTFFTQDTRDRPATNVMP